VVSSRRSCSCSGQCHGPGVLRCPHGCILVPSGQPVRPWEPALEPGLGLGLDGWGLRVTSTTMGAVWTLVKRKSWAIHGRATGSKQLATGSKIMTAGDRLVALRAQESVCKCMVCSMSAAGLGLDTLNYQMRAVPHVPLLVFGFGWCSASGPLADHAVPAGGAGGQAGLEWLVLIREVG